MNLLEYDGTKRRRLTSDFREFTRNSNGFIDSCRFCNKQILRKGQSRPRICLECEKKKATPIHDRCKDCQEPIIRSNVRKARICPKCKKNRERTKNETSYAVTGFPARLPGSGKSNRIYAVNAWLYQLAVQGHELPSAPEPLDHDQLPLKSNVVKIRSEQFNAPEDIVVFLVNRLQQKRLNGAVVEHEEHKEAQTAPILVPQVNPFEVRDVSVEQLRQQNDALAATRSKQVLETPPPMKSTPRIKMEGNISNHSDCNSNLKFFWSDAMPANGVQSRFYTEPSLQTNLLDELRRMHLKKKNVNFMFEKPLQCKEASLTNTETGKAAESLDCFERNLGEFVELDEVRLSPELSSEITNMVNEPLSALIPPVISCLQSLHVPEASTAVSSKKKESLVRDESGNENVDSNMQLEYVKPTVSLEVSLNKDCSQKEGKVQESNVKICLHESHVSDDAALLYQAAFNSVS